MIALMRSGRETDSSRYSGSTSGPNTISSSMTGTPSRKTEPHQNSSRNMPPTSGPITVPRPKKPVQAPIAAPCCLGSWNMIRIRERVEGISVEPAMPSSARAAMSITGLTANAESTEAAPNATAPISSSRRRPTLSPIAPMVMRKPAMTKP